MKKIVGIVLFCLLFGVGVAAAQNLASYCEANADQLLATAPGPIGAELRLYAEREAARQNVNHKIFSHMLAADLCKKGRLPLDKFLAKLATEKAAKMAKTEFIERQTRRLELPVLPAQRTTNFAAFNQKAAKPEAKNHLNIKLASEAYRWDGTYSEVPEDEPSRRQR